MDKFDEKVIGYESTKEILRQILDILKRPEVYKRKGISIPRGLLMESDPGLGKSLLASILMEESERKPFVFRKTSQCCISTVPSKAINETCWTSSVVMYNVSLAATGFG